jgi:hypothetical protein
MLCGVLGGATLVFAVAGFFLGMTIVEWKAGVFGLEQLVMATPGEPRGISITTALLFAWPPISAIVAVVLHRWRQRADAPLHVVLLYFAIPTVLLAGYIVLRTYQYADAAGMELRPMFTVRSLGPGTEEARLAVFASICLWLFIGTRKRPKEVAP